MKTNQINRMGFVYVQRRAPYTSVCVDAAEAKLFYADNIRWSHTATIDPHTWIAYLLNHPCERPETIENLFDATPLNSKNTVKAARTIKQSKP